MRQNLKKNQCIKIVKYTRITIMRYICRTKLSLISFSYSEIYIEIYIPKREIISFMLSDIIYYLTQFFRKYFYYRALILLWPIIS